MRRLVVVAALWGCAGSSRPTPPMPSSSLPFFISSRHSSYMVRGEFWGRLGQSANAIQIQLDSLTVFHPRYPVVARERIRLRPALAYPTPSGRWNIRTLGPAVSLPRIATLRDSILGPLRLSLPLPAAFDASTDYLAFQFDFPDPGGSADATTTWACGYSGMLVGSLPTKAYATGDTYVDEC